MEYGIGNAIFKYEKMLLSPASCWLREIYGASDILTPVDSASEMHEKNNAGISGNYHSHTQDKGFSIHVVAHSLPDVGVL